MFFARIVARRPHIIDIQAGRPFWHPRYRSIIIYSLVKVCVTSLFFLRGEDRRPLVTAVGIQICVIFVSRVSAHDFTVVASVNFAHLLSFNHPCLWTPAMF